MDVFVDCAWSFGAGFADSFRGFIPTNFTINNVGNKNESADRSKSMERSKSVDKPKTPLTTLEERRKKRLETRSVSKPREAEELPSEPPKLWTRVFQIAGINVCVIAVFYWLFLPLLSLIMGTLSMGGSSEPVSHTLGMICILPFFMVTRLCNCLWFQDVANAASLGDRSSNVKSVAVSLSIADLLFSVLLESAFMVQSYLVALIPIPYVSDIATYVHFCLLYSLYSFEYPWMANGVDLKSRLNRLQHNWLYFVGFGSAISCITRYSHNFVVNGCLFGALFPVFIVSSCRAKPPAPPPSLMPLFVFSPSLMVVNKVSTYITNKILK